VPPGVTSASAVIVAETDLGRATRLASVLHSLRWPTHIVRNGDDVMALLRRTPPPPLGVINLLLPRVDGIALLRQARTAGIATPVVALAPLPVFQQALEALELPAVEVLSSTASDEELKAAVLRLLPAADRERPAAGDAAADGGDLSTWLQAHVQQAANELARDFNVAMAIVSVTVGVRQYVGVSVQPERFVVPSNTLLGMPLLNEALTRRELIVLPDLAEHSMIDPSLRVNGLRGAAIMPIAGPHVVRGAACLLDFQPLMLDALALDRFTAQVRAATAELERTIGVRSAERQLLIARNQFAEREADAAQQIAALSDAALKDIVTGLLNRRGGEEALAREEARLQRTRSSAGLVMFDVDHFKDINDRYGHGVGDRVLSEVARVISRIQRASDIAIRWGGEEFLVLLPDNDVVGARRFAERVRLGVESLRIPDVPRITISAGAAELTRMQSAAESVARADRLLYEAKQAGRNQTR